MAPMSTQLGTTTGLVTDEQIAFYRERAQGGVGMIVVEFCCVDRTTGLSEHRQLSIETPAHVERHRLLVDAIRESGTIACLQLQHGGQAGKQECAADGVLRAPCDLFTRREPVRMVARALTDDEIEKLIEDFGVAARAGIEAGYQAVEFHGAHGYLISSFLSPMTNKRDDRWGGDEDRRLEFARRIIERVRAEIDERPLLYRLSADEFSPAGLSIEDMERIVPKLVAFGLDAIHVSTGIGWTGLHNVIEPMSSPEGWRLPYSRRLRAVAGVPVITVGQIRWPETAERALREGDADYIALGRPLLADPHWPAKAAAGAISAIRPCTSCNYCVAISFLPNGKICCAENPRTANENDPLPIVAGEPKAIVVGAGPGGMAAALMLDQAGYRTELIEARAMLGGGLIASAAPPHKAMLDWHRDYLIRKIGNSNVHVSLGRHATAEEIADHAPAIVLLATGGVPVKLAIEGIDSPLVHDAYELLMRDDAWISALPEGPVLVYGGGETGCEMAEYIAARDRYVLLVTRSPAKALARAAEMIYRGVLLQRLRTNPRITLYENTQLVKIGNNHVQLHTKDSDPIDVPVSAAVIAQGRISDPWLAEELTRRGIEVVAIGDAVRGGRIGDAVRDAYQAVRAHSTAGALVGELAC